MKNWTLITSLGLAVFLNSTSATWAAQPIQVREDEGTEIADDGSQEDESEVDESEELIGSEVVSAGIDSEFRAWCGNVLRLLDRARGEAGNLSLRGDYSRAVDRLIMGLYRSSYSYGDLNPVTVRLMQHGYTLGVTLKAQARGDIRGLKAAAIALESMYDLIANNADTIDYRYYRCAGQRRHCRYNATREFESQMLTMARDLLDLVNSNLLVSTGRQIFPVGPSSAYLKSAEVITRAAYTDLRTLVYANAYACEIADLADISRDLKVFNMSAPTEVMKKEKVYQTYYDIQEISTALSAGGCN
ncbi:MAG: hypothetical protein AB7I27_05045 [Bacteriovoracaceae bacterium]